MSLADLAQAPQLLLLHDAEAVALHAAASTALAALRRLLAAGVWAAPRGGGAAAVEPGAVEPGAARSSAETRELRALLERLRELLAPRMPGAAEDDEDDEGGEDGGGGEGGGGGGGGGGGLGVL